MDLDWDRLSEAESMLGETLAGRYRLTSLIGMGAMGKVFKARHTSLGKDVCVKVMHSILATNVTALRRFQQEARAASRLRHPNCVATHDFGALDDGTLYIVMDLIRGFDLQKLLEREFWLDQARVVRIALQIGIALEEAHANGVVHRDLKPANIMIDERPEGHDDITVLDFGLAQILTPGDGDLPGDSRITRSGLICDSPSYISPEQLRKEVASAQSDIYSLGVVMYELATGLLPFRGESPVETASLHLREMPEPPRWHNPQLHAKFDALIMHMLAKERSERVADCRELLAALAELAKLLGAEGLASGPAGVAIDPEVRAQQTRSAATALDRRRFPRRPLEEALHCYIAGVKCKATCVDISAGGGFLSTDGEIPVGTTVAVVFKRQEGIEHPSYLLGTAVRQQEGEFAGVGVRWNRAISTGEPVDLAAFLYRLLGIKVDGIRVTDSADPEERRAVYRFVASEDPQVVHETSSQAGRKAGTKVHVAGSQVELPMASPAAMETADHSGDGDSPGAITTRVNRAVRAPARLPAVIEMGLGPQAGTVTHLGKEGMFVAAGVEAASQGGEASVEFVIRTRRGDLRMKCNCRIAAVDTGEATGRCGVDLQIVSVDEGDQPGILESYVRWLHFRFFAED